MSKAVTIFWIVAVILTVATLLLILSEMQLVILERKKRRSKVSPPVAPPPMPMPMPIPMQVPARQSAPQPQLAAKPKRRRRKRGLVDIPLAAIIATAAGWTAATVVASLPFIIKEKEGKASSKRKSRKKSTGGMSKSQRIASILR